MAPPSILVLHHAALEGPGLLGEAFAAAGGRLTSVHTHAGEPVPRELGDARALVVMGGPMGVYEADRHPHLRDELRLLERALAAGLPTLGICLGSQLLATAAGATVRSSGRQEIGWLPVTLGPAADGDPLFAGAPRSFAPLHWHGDVFTLPPGATPLASSALTEHQAFRVGDHAWGMLFHLEADAAQVAAMAGAFAADLAVAGVVPEALLAATPAALAAARPVADTIFGRFVARALA